MSAQRRHLVPRDADGREPVQDAAFLPAKREELAPGHIPAPHFLFLSPPVPVSGFIWFPEGPFVPLNPNVAR